MALRPSNPPSRTSAKTPALTEVISNTSPLQYLYQTDLIDLLPSLFGAVTVPDAVLEELAEVERIVNEQIQRDLSVTSQAMSLEQAQESGAIGLFEDRYGDRVSVYTIGASNSVSPSDVFSREICGGPHVERTGELGRFRIAKHQSIGSGMRRIRAVLEPPQ